VRDAVSLSPDAAHTTSTCTLRCALAGQWCHGLAAGHIHVRETTRPAPWLHASMWCRPRSNFNGSTLSERRDEVAATHPFYAERGQMTRMRTICRIYCVCCPLRRFLPRRKWLLSDSITPAHFPK
jgi:hypothetical protein